MSAFSRSDRLISREDFQSVFASSRKTARKYLLALCSPNQLSNARLGMVVAKRHLKLAVHRNALRRVVRESFRQHKDLLKGLDIIVVLRSKWSPLGDKKALRLEVDKLWQLISSSKPV